MTMRFDLRKSPVDGKVRRWDTKMASQVEGLGLVENANTGELDYDYPVQVCTGVFDNKKAALRAAGIKVK
jgi:hypothetical protein